MNLNELKQKMDEARYIYDDTLATVLAVALQLGRPLLIEGAAGVGKTEIAKVMASALDRDLVRLQCYEGLDESKALYEWNYQKQLLSIQVNQAMEDKDALTKSLFSDEYLLERPLLQSIRSPKPVVLLIEGAAGVGKTEIAKVMASALDRDLVRLQCYEGLDESKALYEWNYQKQLLSIQVNMNETDKDALTRSLFSDEYLLERPLLQSIRSEKPVVLLIDEIDKADEEFEAFLLELLSDMQVSIPEVGTIRAKTIPFVVLTSNRARPLSEALRRRCAYLYIEYPDMEKELAILRAKLPHVDDRLAAQVALAVQKLRANEVILKKPSIAETLDWAAALDALGIRELTPDALRQTAGFVLKNNEDINAMDLDEDETHDCQCGGSCGHHQGGHHHG